MNDRKEKKKNEFYIHPYITNGYYIAFASHPHYFRFSFFLYSVKKRREKKKKQRKKVPIDSYIHHGVSLLQTIALYPSPFRSISSMLSSPWRLLDLFCSLILVFSSLNYYYTLCTHNNIYILHTHIFHLLILQHAWLCIRSYVFFCVL